MATVRLTCEECGCEFERLYKKRFQKFCSKSCLTSHTNRCRARIKGGVEKHPLYPVWSAMRRRCNFPADKDFHKYGARGITIDQRWDDFLAFVADMSERPEGTTLDRKDNDGPYSPENCRWATPQEQSNNRRSNHLLTHDGKTQTMAQWCRELGWPLHTLKNRITAQGWSVDRALTTPVHRRCSSSPSPSDEPRPLVS